MTSKHPGSRSAASLLALLILTPAALAATTYQYSAYTTEPAKLQGKVSASGVTWVCQSTRCTTSGPWPNPAVSACHALAQQVGQMHVYGHKGHMLTPDELQQCNAGVQTSQSASSGGHATRSITINDFQKLVQSSSPEVHRVQATPHTQPGDGRGPAVINTDTLRYAGHGPVVINTETLRYSGRSAVVINMETLRYTGQGAVVINTDTLRYSGQWPVVINTNTLRYSGTKH